MPCDDSGRPLKLVSEKELEEPCAECGAGTMRVKRRGVRAFLGCDQYPKCKAAKPLPEGVRVERKTEPVVEAGVNCERCGRPLVIRKGRRGEFIACSGFPRCRNAKPIEKLVELRAAAAAAGGASGSGGEPREESASVGSAKGAKGRSTGGKSAGKTAAAGADPGKLGTPPPGFAWTRTGKLVVEAWPEGPLHCPECGSELQLKAGRFGPFFSCTNFPKCRCSVNLRGEAKKQAEIEMPATPKPKPIPTDIRCEECGEPMLIRSGRSGKFLGCSAYPKCRNTKPVPAELMLSGAKTS